MVTIIEKQKDMIAQLRNIDGMLRVNQGIPAQVLLSKPVVLLDARSRLAPFHVEFIDSVEVGSLSSILRASEPYAAYTGFDRCSEDSV